ncbi:hypothetical protein R1U54_000067 [Vibrio fluvialis]|nr:hypothetical protein [Vibrio fluvialis]ELP2650014.1 hypothetical protein [Vibrio fluvialis]
MSKTLPSEAELRESYIAFAKHTFELLSDIDKKKLNLMFAAVSSQVALELFLKYLFTVKGKVNEIRKAKSGKLTNDFKDFNQILSAFYSTRTWSFGQKKELIELMQTRNSIVHRGQKAAWDPDIAKIVVKTLFFMHATAKSDLDEVLFFDNYNPHHISNVKVWREGVSSFCDELVDIYDCDVLTCTACNSFSVVSGELLGLQEGCCVSDLVCLCCLTSINIEREARLLECYECGEKSYIIDAYNEQDDQLYVGKCSECHTDTWVRKCPDCESFYHPKAEKEVFSKGKYFCSKSCEECHN